ncbi:MAG: hypothetical protein QOI12_5079 [Alphaproteobacteria bacterium]|jgi:Flp pilus assembly protein TadD|nr:hypothetical protein [Alphaproteobacteria bacterium]
MRAGAGRVLIVALASLLWLSGCETSSKFGDLLGTARTDDPQATGSLPDRTAAADPATTGSVSDGAQKPYPQGILGTDPNDDLSLGKKYYRAANYGLAERHFRRAVEAYPRDAEAWVGLAACYDRLRRFELADRAYNQAIGIVGPTAEILNNKGYSYILRSDYKRARQTLLAAQAQDPDNPYIQNNLELLEKATHKGKAVQ